MRNEGLKKVGFWFYELFADSPNYRHLPRAQDQVDKSWDPREREVVLVYVTNRKFESTGYRGSSGCRFCEKTNGSHDYTDGTYVWPEGFGHYIEKHEVKPPQDFIDHVLAQPKTPEDAWRSI